MFPVRGFEGSDARVYGGSTAALDAADQVVRCKSRWRMRNSIEGIERIEALRRAYTFGYYSHIDTYGSLWGMAFNTEGM
jgi:hypothetical protein